MKTSLRIRRIRKSVEMYARFVGIKFELYSRQSTKLVVVAVVVVVVVTTGGSNSRCEKECS